MTVPPEETERLIREYGAARMKVAYAKDLPESVKQEAAREVQVTHYALRQAINRHHSGLGEIKMYLDTIVEHLTTQAEGDADGAAIRSRLPSEVDYADIDTAAEAAILAATLLRNTERAAPPSGEAPRLTIEQVREALSAAGVQPSLETIFARQFPGQVSDAEVERLADALNALLGSAPEKEQVDSVTYPKDGP